MEEQIIIPEYLFLIAAMDIQIYPQKIFHYLMENETFFIDVPLEKTIITFFGKYPKKLFVPLQEHIFFS